MPAATFRLPGPLMTLVPETEPGAEGQGDGRGGRVGERQVGVGTERQRADGCRGQRLNCRPLVTLSVTLLASSAVGNSICTNPALTTMSTNTVWAVELRNPHRPARTWSECCSTGWRSARSAGQADDVAGDGGIHGQPARGRDRGEDGHALRPGRDRGAAAEGEEPGRPRLDEVAIRAVAEGQESQLNLLVQADVGESR